MTLLDLQALVADDEHGDALFLSRSDEPSNLSIVLCQDD
ncbi:SapB/AmfS family lanthipeptide [Streptomyces mashuensis]|nr:SapB/AmfS family lanthipeptide [Streptomyces mashuensis]